MKKFLFIILLAFSIPAIAQIKSASLTASGLTCSMCSKAIYKSLLQVPTVKVVRVDIKNSKYNIEFKEGTNVVLDDIKKAVSPFAYFAYIFCKLSCVKLGTAFHDVRFEIFP